MPKGRWRLFQLSLTSTSIGRRFSTNTNQKVVDTAFERRQSGLSIAVLTKVWVSSIEKLWLAENRQISKSRW